MRSSNYIFFGHGSVWCSQLGVNHLARDQSMTTFFKVVPNKLITFNVWRFKGYTFLSL